MLTFFAFACDNPVHDDDDDDHTDAVGFVLVQDNSEILRYENDFIYNDEVWPDYFREHNGSIHFTLSPDVIEDMETGLTPAILIRWLDSDGDIFDQEEDSEYTLDFTWSKPSDDENCDLEDRQSLDEPETEIRPANIELHDEEPWEFHFRADHVGEATISWTLNHDGHSDFTSTVMTVIVADDKHELLQNGQYLHAKDRCRTR